VKKIKRIVDVWAWCIKATKREFNKTCSYVECKDECGFYISECEKVTWNGPASALVERNICSYCRKPIKIVRNKTNKHKTGKKKNGE